MSKIQKLSGSKGAKIGPYRCIFPNLVSPEPYQEGQEAKYAIKILIPKSDKENLKLIEQYINAEVEASPKFKQSVKPRVKKRAKDFQEGENKNCIFKDGDIINARRKEDEKEPYEAYNDHYVLSFSKRTSYGPIVIADSHGNILDKDLALAEIQSGYWVKLHVTSYCYPKPDPGISLQLQGVQKIKDDEIFGQTNVFEDETDGGEVSDANPFEESA